MDGLLVPYVLLYMHQWYKYKAAGRGAGPADQKDGTTP